jgi:hypothetical protein
MAKLLSLKEYVDYEFKEIETLLTCSDFFGQLQLSLLLPAKRCDQISEEDLRSNDSFKLQDIREEIKQMG